MSEPPVSAPISKFHDKEIVVLVVESNVKSPGLDGSIPVVAFTNSVQSDSPIRLLTLIRTAYVVAG